MTMIANGELHNVQEAVKWFMVEFCPDGKLIRTINGSRGTPIGYVAECDSRRNYVLFKRDWFYKFSEIYSQVPKSDKGIGQTFNMKIVPMAASELAYLVVVMPKKVAYEVLASDADDYIAGYETSRTPSSEVSEEGSIPAKMLKRMKK
jgi:hypothetical protein